MNKLKAMIAQKSSRNIEKKKVLIAVGSLSGGGAERVASVWAGQLADKGYDVSIFIYSHKDNEYPISHKVKIYSCANTANEYISKSLFTRYKEIRQTIKSVKPDYIIPFLFSIQFWMFIASLGLGIRRVETIRINPWIFTKYYNLVDRLLLRLFYTSAYKIVIQASDQKPWFTKRNQKKCVLIPNPISDIYKESYREEISTQVVNFIAAGRIDPQKNYPMMIDAFAKAVKQYPNIRLQIFGKGDTDYTQMLQNKINSLEMQNNIFLMGRSATIHEEYKKNDVFLMSSDFEGLPNALMEAMASRLICISTDCKTGPRDLINEGVSGYMVPVGDSNALADTIIKVINMSYEERVEMADAARNKIMTYCSEESSLNKLCEILNK